CHSAQRNLSAAVRTSGLAVVADAGIDHRVEQVDDEIHEHEHHRHEHHAPLHRSEIPRLYREQKPAPQPGPGENGLGDDGSPQEIAELETDHGEGGNEGVLEHVLDEHDALRESLGPGGANVVEVQYLE